MTIKRQHYVPQFYLKEFKIPNKNGSQISCFDKKLDSIFVASVSKVAAESYFNDFDEDQSFEKALSKFEGMVIDHYKNLVKSQSLAKLTPVDKAAIAYFIAVQHSRTRRSRDIIKDASEKVLEQAQEIGVVPDKRVYELFTEEGAKRFQYHLMAMTSSKFTKLLLKRKWTLVINQTEIPFWTSDSPLVYFNSFPYDKHDGFGFERSGSELYFPMNPWLNLAVIDERIFQNVPDEIVVDDEDEIIFYNQLQVIFSKRFIYSSNKDFSIAQDILINAPSLKNVNRNYFENEGVDLSNFFTDDTS